ncbi:MAG: hypothetical protein JW888_10860, partial [Pirellulales bacterium]|nr:hypothetical protein [Pirellulales bacterium]
MAKQSHMGRENIISFILQVATSSDKPGSWTGQRIFSMPLAEGWPCAINCIMMGNVETTHVFDPNRRTMTRHTAT